MSRDLDAIRLAAGLRGFSYNINDIQTVKNADADAASMKLINSRILINNVGLLLDSDFYTFFDLMNDRFPSHLRMHSFMVSRTGPLTEQVLNGLSGPNALPVVVAEASYDWMTLVPLPPVDPNNPQAGAQ